MEVGGLPLLNCLWQQALRGLCSDSSRWVYAVFWRILPRNYPPPRWHEVWGVSDRSLNKRDWILVWEDGFCDFEQCRRGGGRSGSGAFGPDVFFKLSHEVYNYGEGLVGKVAAKSSHKWVFREIPSEKNDPNSVSTWNGSRDPHPRAWESHFSSGIQTIAIVAVREGVVQLGSLHKVPEGPDLVISIQRQFINLQSIPGIFAMQRPCPANSERQHAHLLMSKLQANSALRRLPPAGTAGRGLMLSRLPRTLLPGNRLAPGVGASENDAIFGRIFYRNLNQAIDGKPTSMSHCFVQPCEEPTHVEEELGGGSQGKGLPLSLNYDIC